MKVDKSMGESTLAVVVGWVLVIILIGVILWKL
jgi:hypothetical protein